MKFQNYTFNIWSVAKNSAGYNIVFTRKIGTKGPHQCRPKSDDAKTQYLVGSTLFALIQEIFYQSKSNTRCPNI